MKIKQYHLLN